MTPTKIEFAGRGTSGVWHIATDSVENLLLDLRDAVTVEDAHGMVLRVTSAAVVGVNYVQHLSQHGSLDISSLLFRPPIGLNALPLINQLVIEISWWFLQTSRE